MLFVYAGAKEPWAMCLAANAGKCLERSEDASSFDWIFVDD